MRDHGDYGVGAQSRKVLLALLGGLALLSCAHPVRPMLNDHTMVISGRATAGNDTLGATRKVLVVAARLTLDHGFRYFKIAGLPKTPGRGGASSIRPGADVTVEVYRDGEVDPRSADVWDAENIGAGGLPDGAR